MTAIRCGGDDDTPRARLRLRQRDGMHVVTRMYRTPHIQYITNSGEWGGTVWSESLFPTNPVDVPPGQGTRVVPRTTDSHEQFYRERTSEASERAAFFTHVFASRAGRRSRPAGRANGREAPVSREW